MRIANAPETVVFDGADRHGCLAMHLAANRAEPLRELRHQFLKRDAAASRVKLDDVICHTTGLSQLGRGERENRACGSRPASE